MLSAGKILKGKGFGNGVQLVAWIICFHFEIER